MTNSPEIPSASGYSVRILSIASYRLSACHVHSIMRPSRKCAVTEYRDSSETRKLFMRKGTQPHTHQRTNQRAYPYPAFLAHTFSFPRHLAASRATSQRAAVLVRHLVPVVPDEPACHPFDSVNYREQGYLRGPRPGRGGRIIAGPAHVRTPRAGTLLPSSKRPLFRLPPSPDPKLPRPLLPLR